MLQSNISFTDGQCVHAQGNWFKVSQAATGELKLDTYCKEDCAAPCLLNATSLKLNT